MVNIARIVKEIEAGNLVVTPTDTVYGILADAMNPEAVEKVYCAKQRSKAKPLLLLVSDMEMLHQCVKELSLREEEIIKKYWPGKLTILLKKSDGISDVITNGGNLVGIRMPDNAELREIIKKVGRPLVSTSANLSEKVTAINPKHLEPEVLKYISYVENAGTVESEPSAIIKVVDGDIEVVRGGEVAEELLRNRLYF